MRRMSGSREAGRMRSFSGRRLTVYGMISAGLFLVLFLGTFRRRTEGMEREEFQVVAFGDSFFGEVRDETSVPALLQALTGKSVYNAGLGGTCMARQPQGRRMDYGKDSLSMVGLARAVGTDDFGVQQTVRMRETNTEYFEEDIDRLETIDFSRVETVLIQQGVNDYHAGIPIENPEDPYDEYTFLGALRTTVGYLRRANPEVRILLVTPTYTWYIFPGLTCEEADQGGGLLEDYVEAELGAAGELGIEVIDVYHDFFPHETWEDKDAYTRDGLHPNEEGREKLAGRIAQELCAVEDPEG